MSEDLSQGAPSTPEPAAPPPSISDRATQAIEVAAQRAADREAGKDVPDALPTLTIPVKRASDGKFAVQDKAKAPAPAVEPASKPEGDTNAAPPGAPRAAAEPAPQAQPALQPNARWSDAHKATFAKLPRDAQEAILGMSDAQTADYTRKTQELADQRKHVEPLVAAYNEHADFLNHYAQRAGITPVRVMGDMAQLLRQGTTGQPHERAQALGFVAQLFGIDPRSLAQQPQGAQQGQPLPQQVQMPPAIERELRQRDQQIADLNRRLGVHDQRNEHQVIQSAQQQIDAFANAKDESGQLKHPHFDAVRELMARHVEAGSSFEDAYAAAAKPITDAISAAQGQRQAAQQADEQQRRDAAAASQQAEAARVANARRGAGPRHVGSTPGGQTKARTVEDRTTEAMRAAGFEI